MTVQVQDPVITYTANGSTTSFSFPFRIIISSDVKVYLDGVLQAAGYSVTGVNNASGGDVIFTAAPTSGVLVRLQRINTLDRNVDYIQGGKIISETVDTEFDRTIQMIQDLDRVSFKETSAATLDAANRRLVNVSEPINAQDVASKNFVETSGTSAAAAALVSEANAATSAAAALVSETNAATSETNAATSETNADASETNAASSETNAATSETNAATSAAAALVSETNADTSETNAATSAAAALVSETNALASEKEAGSVYLGAYATAPTTDKYGQPLVVGATYMNTTNDPQDMWMYTSTGWALQVASPAQTAGDVAVVDSIGVFATSNAEDVLAEIATSTTSLVRNGDFTNNLINWTNTSTGTATAVLDTTTHTDITGNTIALTIAADADIAEIESDMFIIRPNIAHKLEMRLKVPSNVLVLTEMILDTYDAAGVFLASVGLMSTLGQNVWIGVSTIISAANIGAAVQGKVRIREKIFSSGTYTTSYVTDLTVQQSIPSDIVTYNGVYSSDTNAKQEFDAIGFNRGTWTPTFEGSTGAGTGWVFANQSGKWTTYGDLMFLDFRLTATTKSTDATGTLYIMGLPAFVGSNTAGSVKTVSNITEIADFTHYNVVAHAANGIGLNAYDIYGNDTRVYVTDAVDGVSITGSIVVHKY